MLRIIAIATVLIAFVSFTASGFAEAKGHGAMATGHADTYVTGTIMSVDAATNKVVIREASGMDTTVVVGAKDAPTLKAGDTVKAKMKQNTNTAVSVTPFVKQ